MTDNDKPPFFSTWTKLYTFIASYLVLLIVAMYIFTIHYS
jgi:hypothetical protein